MTDERHDDIDSQATTSTALEMRRPDVPVNLDELAAQKAGAIEIIEARAQVLTTLRKAAISATSPEDWLLFKAPDEQGGQVVAYLQDCGADRVRDLYGIEVFNVGRPERVMTNDPLVFHYLIRGSGRCKLTRQVLVDVEGGRSSTDDFCKGKTGVDLELAVRKAARANLDGAITRELAGLKSVPLSELEEVWTNTRKKTANCRRGRGFGTRDERLGAAAVNAPDVDPPKCPHCGATGVYRPAKGTRGAFYGCPQYGKHPDKKFIVDAGEWASKHPKANGLSPANAAGFTGEPTGPASGHTGGDPFANTRPQGKVTPPSADEVFGNKNHTREPGEEG
jgi:hypothetical protein